MYSGKKQKLFAHKFPYLHYYVIEKRKNCLVPPMKQKGYSQRKRKQPNEEHFKEHIECMFTLAITKLLLISYVSKFTAVL